MALAEAPEVMTVWMTAPDVETAEKLGRTLVEERLAACANMLPGVVSVFRWEGEIQRGSEVLLVLKTTPRRLSQLERRAMELHPYDVPEILALPVTAGTEAYLSWVGSEVS